MSAFENFISNNWNKKLTFLPVASLPTTGINNTLYYVNTEPTGFKFWNGTEYESIGGGISPTDIINNFATDPSDVNKVAGANAVYALYQLVASDDVSYDTIQEIVNFIKTIDTDGELVAAIDAAAGGTAWREETDISGKVDKTALLYEIYYPNATTIKLLMETDVDITEIIKSTSISAIEYNIDGGTFTDLDINNDLPISFTAGQEVGFKVNVAGNLIIKGTKTL